MAQTKTKSPFAGKAAIKRKPPFSASESSYTKSYVFLYQERPFSYTKSGALPIPKFQTPQQPPETIKTHTSDIIMIEIDKIYNEDCLEGMKRIDDGSVDAVITDLPFGTTCCSWDSVIPFEPLWEQFRRITKPNAAIVLFGSEPFSSALRMSNIKEWREDIVWLKNKPASGFKRENRHMKIHEMISVFSQSGEYTFNPQKWLVDSKEFLTQRKTFLENEYIGNNIYGATHRTRRSDDGTRYPISIVSAKTPHSPSYSKDYDADTEIRFHPTQKPVDLLRYLVLTYTNEGDTVLDSCMGSGTTAIACLKEKRHFLGFELNKEYFDIAQRRIALERSQPTLDFGDELNEHTNYGTDKDKITLRRQGCE